MQAPRTAMTSGRRALRGAVLMLSTIIPLAAAGAAGEGTPGLFGFTPQESAAQRSLEQRFDADLKPAELREWQDAEASISSVALVFVPYPRSK